MNMALENRIHFLATVCHVCKSKTTPYTCEICKMIFYCSPEHRRENWVEHSGLCWSLNKISQAEGKEQIWDLFDGKNFTAFRHDIASKCISLLGRSLMLWECEMIYYPRVCEICWEFDWEKLKTCPECEFVFSCEKGHFRKDHPRWCKTFKIYSILNVKENLSFKHELQKIDWGDHQTMEDLLSLTFGSGSSIDKILYSEILTYPITVLNSLKLIKALERQQLTVLFVGAEIQAEVQPLKKWEWHLLHYLKPGSQLSLIFLGPELLQASGEHWPDLCQICRSENKNLKFGFIPGKFYHEYSFKLQPDLICALNSGMYRNFGFKNENSWESTILRLFAREGPPVLLTEYTCRELKLDSEKIQSQCGQVKTIVEPQINPFASLKPGLNVFFGDDTPVIFKNYFYSVYSN